MKWLNQLRRGSNLLLILVILYGLICGRLGKSGSFYWVVFGAVLVQHWIILQRSAAENPAGFPC